MTQPFDSSAQEVTESAAGAGARARWRRQYWSVLAAVLIAVGGISATVVGASSVAQTASQESEQQFVAGSAQIASTLQLSIEREQDLVVDGEGYVLGNPGGTDSEFKQWTTSVQVLSRYPELQELGYLEIVPAAALPSYANKERRSPNGPLGARRSSP